MGSLYPVAKMSKGLQRLALVIGWLSCCWVQHGLATSTNWIGDYKDSIEYECDLGAHISYFKSQHKNAEEDRRWAFACTQAHFPTGQCKWLEYTPLTTNWAGEAYCEYDDGDWGIITGMKSHYLTEDRRWSYKCCKTNMEFENCRWTAFKNDYDEEFEHTVQYGRVATGVHTKWDSTKGDRIWKFRICDVKDCKADNIEFLESVTAEHVDTKIVGVTTATGCNQGVTYYLGLGHEATTSDSVHYGKSSSGKVTWGASVSVSTGVDVKAPFVGGLEVDVTVEQSFGGEHSWSLENMKGKETTSGAYAHQYMKFVGPGAALMFATSKKYKYAASGIAAKFTGTCYTYDKNGNVKNSSPYESEGTLEINGDHYGVTQYVTRMSHNYDGTSCGSWANLRGCVQELQTDNLLNATTLLANFDACLTALGGETARSQTYTKSAGTPWELGTPVDVDHEIELELVSRSKYGKKKTEL